MNSKKNNDKITIHIRVYYNIIMYAYIYYDMNAFFRILIEFYFLSDIICEDRNF